MKNYKNPGFSLTELSVVLVIIGLITAAIAGGSHLMQTAKLNKVIAEFTGYKKSIENFRLKYDAWPGDMANAISFWGSYNATNNPEGTENGDGDEQINLLSTEVYTTWQQLALSGMINGHYTGLDAGTPDFQININVPGSEFSKTAHYILAHTGSTDYFDNTGTFLSFSANADPSYDPWTSVITAADANLIDKKTDDGYPTTGDIIFFPGDEFYDAAVGNSKCLNKDYDESPPALAILTDATISCRMFLWLQKD